MHPGHWRTECNGMTVKDQRCGVRRAIKRTFKMLILTTTRLPLSSLQKCAKFFVIPFIILHVSYVSGTETRPATDGGDPTPVEGFPSIEEYSNWGQSDSYTSAEDEPVINKSEWGTSWMDWSIWDSSWWNRYLSPGTSSPSDTADYYCDTNPCSNGGVCYLEGDSSYYCECEPEFTGIHCETEIAFSNPCDCDPCFNGGSCFIDGTSATSFSCYCRDGFIGHHCESALSDPCEPDPCDFGFCYHDNTVSRGYLCECDTGYNGTHCQHDYLKPYIHCEAGLSVQLEQYEDSVEVYWDTPEAWDNSEETTGGEVDVWCDPPSGTTFVEGERKVWCYAVDESDNKNKCHFYVTVTRSPVPEIYCIGDLTQPAAPGEGFAIVEYPPPSLYNAETYSCWPASGDMFNVGEHTVTCQAWKSGISARCNFNVFIRDLQNPEITCPENVRKNTAYQAPYNQVWWEPPVVWDNAGFPDRWCEPASGDVFWLGEHVVICYAVDKHGNEERCSFEVEVYDEEPPNIACPGRKIQPTDWGRDTSEVWFGDFQTWDNSEEYVDVDCEPREGHFHIGITEVICVATDESGNTKDCSFEVDVYDNEPPSIVCPPDIYKRRDAGDAGVRVDWELRAWDNTGEDPNTGCKPDQEHLFLFGRTTVTCVAEDASHNRDNCQFTVEVTDHDVPTIICPADIEVETLPGEGYNKVYYDEPTYFSTSNQELEIHCSHDPGRHFYIGSTMVECTATNPAGIASGCVFFIEVVDNEDPTIQCPSDQRLISLDGGPVKPTFSDGPRHDDNSGDADWWCNPHLNTEFSVGLWETTCYAIDGSQNIAECTFKISVVSAVSLDPCEGDFNQCNENGICITLDTNTGQYRCACFEPWMGDHCQDKNYCDVHPCGQNGVCSNVDDGYKCRCSPGWTGENCQDMDHCFGEPCGMNGECENYNTGYKCECFDGWSGENCNEPPVDIGGGEGNETGGGDARGPNDTQTANSAGIIIGAAAAGVVILIVVVVTVIVFCLMRNKSAKRPGRLSTQPLAPSNATSSPQIGNNNPPGKMAYDNSAYNRSNNSRYAHALPTVSGGVRPSAPGVHQHPPPRLSTGNPPSAGLPTSPTTHKMPPPAYTKKPSSTAGNKIPPRLPSMPPSAIYSGGSVIYSRSGSTGTYGGYERPDMAPGEPQDFSNNVYEEVDDVVLKPPTYHEAYTELGPPDSGYMDLN